VKYFRAKKIVTELTTISVHQPGEEKILFYNSSDDLDYFGVDTQNVEGFIASQPVELEVQELSYQDMKPILDNCQLMSDFNSIIEKQIAEKYSFGRELKMRDLSLNDPERAEYEAFKESIKIPVRLKKVEFGLILAS